MNTEIFFSQLALNKKNEEAYLRKRVVVDYVPYEEKIAACKAIIMSSCTSEGRYVKNTPSQFMLFAMTLIDRYTDIDINKENMLDEFNQFDSRDLVNVIISFIPSHEYKTWELLIKMVDDDFYENEHSLVSFLEHKLDTITQVIDSIEETQTPS